jgi:dienelactone hydrolase
MVTTRRPRASVSIGVGALLLYAAAASALAAAPEALEIGSIFAAVDTLDCGTEPNSDAKECLDKLSWPPGKFTVRLEAAEPGCGDWLVRFASARPIGNTTNDLVAMEWYAAKDAEGRIRQAPAIVVLHESGRRMTVGRLIAQGLNLQGLHAFLLHLPGYGSRRVPGIVDTKLALPALHQAISDVRRARDAVAALPNIDRSMVGLQGTSLGGFVAATVVGLDHGYNRAFILLAGGNLNDVVFNGAKDAAKLRKKLADAGITDDQIKELARQVEPLRLAHRIDPATTWLYSGTYDEVVPPSCSRALAQGAHLRDGHFVEIPASHYTGVLYLPQAVQEISQHMLQPSESR